jgi:hypothetical protein
MLTPAPKLRPRPAEATERLKAWALTKLHGQHDPQGESGLVTQQCFPAHCLYGGRNRLQVAV